MIGTHHASPMFARSAPCAIAIRRPSPVLFGGDTAAHRPAQKCLDQLFIPFEPAGAQHDTGAGPNTNVFAVMKDSHTDDGTDSAISSSALASVCGVTPRSSSPFNNPAISAVPATQ